MLYRVTNKTNGPIQLALHSTNGKGTKLITLPYKKTYDIPEERYSTQIENLRNRGEVVVEKVYKKRTL